MALSRVHISDQLFRLSIFFFERVVFSRDRPAQFAILVGLRAIRHSWEVETHNVMSKGLHPALRTAGLKASPGALLRRAALLCLRDILMLEDHGPEATWQFEIRSYRLQRAGRRITKRAGSTRTTGSICWSPT